ncbi:MAG TPA: ROK family transcriptional regulator [Firmicutes bacterium]|nr:ROK family transcriptional regulator [Bacillota bacterium]
MSRRKLMPTGKPKVIAAVNQSIVLDLIRNESPISRAEIARKTRLSRPTVSKIVDGLIAKGLVYEIGQGATEGRSGRRPIVLQYNSRAGFVAGADLGAEKVVVAVADLQGNIISEVRRDRDPKSGGNHLLRSLMDAFREALAQGEIDRKKLRGIAIGVPGVTDAEKGVVILSRDFGQENLPLGRIFAEEFGLMTFVENDVNLAALGEARWGVGRKYKDIAYIRAGRGIGAGIIINRHLHRGSRGLAGEIGYMGVAEGCLQYRKQGLTSVGYLESIASISAVITNMIAEAERDETALVRELTNGNPELIAMGTVFKAAEEGNDTARRLLDRAITYLGIGVANLISVLDPEIVVIGGEISLGGEKVLERLRSVVDSLTFMSPPIMFSNLGENAVIMGGISRILDYVHTGPSIMLAASRK